MNCTKWMTTLCVLGWAALIAAAQVAIRGEKVYTMAGPPIDNGVVVIRDGKIAAVGKSADVTIPSGFEVLEARIVTPGLVDAHATVGLTGIYNQKHDQDQIEGSKAIQPELRALDAYNVREELVAWVRSFGVTTVNTGHAPGELISGQTMVIKTTGNTVEESAIKWVATIAATLSPMAEKSGGKSPGTRGKMAAMLRAEFLKARAYLKKMEEADESKRPARDLELEAIGRVLKGEVPLLITVNRSQDIATALRLRREFDIPMILDSASEAYLLIDEIKEAGVPVIVHPPMYRSSREMVNSSFETAAALKHAGIQIALQSGYESYVPKTRVVLFEAAIVAANGLTFDEALATITIDAARILGVDQRVGSLEVGKDGDVALYDGDPFEYTSHCIGVVIDGKVVSDKVR
jgi:imidazolonepropionase-like amidohydrolase